MASAASEKTNREARKRQAKDIELTKTVVKSLMSHPDGRRWVWLMMNEDMVFHEGENLDPYVMAYQKGVRRSGLRMMAWSNRYAPDMYIQMLRENSPVELQSDDNEPSEEEEE